MDIYEIALNFELDGRIINILENDVGLINKSYVIITSTNKYIIQKINKSVFNNPIAIMENIKIVTEHLQKQNESCESLKLISTKTGNYYLVNNDDYYRCYNYLKNSISYNYPHNLKHLYELGKTIARFHYNLKELKITKLKETIINFHDTKIRYNNLVTAFINSDSYRQQETIELYNFVIDNKDNINNINFLLQNGSLPKRIVHNDTKFNNLIFNRLNNKAKCLIDLDTVMPGSILFDFGDAMRSAGTSTNEEDFDFNKLDFDLDKFTYFTIGYLSNAKDLICEQEINLLYDSILMITFECGMRFLTDYLEYDKYFKINFPKHNLLRAKNQLLLSKKIIEKKEIIIKTIKLIKIRFNL